MANLSKITLPNNVQYDLRDSHLNGHSVYADVPSDAVFTDTTYSAMTGATSTVAGSSGLVPAPAAGNQDSYLKGDGTWDLLGNIAKLTYTVVSTF